MSLFEAYCGGVAIQLEDACWDYIANDPESAPFIKPGEKPSPEIVAQMILQKWKERRDKQEL